MKAQGIGLFLRAERVRRNWTQGELAIEAGVGINTVHRGERLGRLSGASARKLAAALGIKVSGLVPSNANARAERRAR